MLPGSPAQAGSNRKIGAPEGEGESEELRRFRNQSPESARFQRRIGGEAEEREQIREDEMESAEDLRRFEESEAADFSRRQSRRLLKLDLRRRELEENESRRRMRRRLALAEIDHHHLLLGVFVLALLPQQKDAADLGEVPRRREAIGEVFSGERDFGRRLPQIVTPKQ